MMALGAKTRTAARRYESRQQGQPSQERIEKSCVAHRGEIILRRVDSDALSDEVAALSDEAAALSDEVAALSDEVVAALSRGGGA